jgi:purine-binding chemotaxis protein CheW
MAVLNKAATEKRAARRSGDRGTRVEYLALALGRERYGVQIAHIAEILRLPPITEVPRASRNVLGVVSVRGRLVTVIDLRRRFGLDETPIDRRSRVLLADAGTGEQMGLLVDEVQQVWRLAPDEIEAPGALGGEQPAHIAGIGRPAGSDGVLLILLNIAPILQAP